MGFLSAILPSVISAGASLFGASKTNKANNANAAADRQLQLDAAQKGIQWKVADAKAAGVHPIYALGAAPFNMSPTSIGQADGWSAAGQDLGRAAGALMSERERRAEVGRMAADRAERARREGILFNQQVDRNSLENDFLRSRIAMLNAPGTPPGFPSSGGSDVGPGVTRVVPARSTSPSVSSRAREAGSIRDYGYADNDYGGLRVVPSEDVHERIEDNWPQQLAWSMTNQILPFIDGLRPPSADEFPLPRGFHTWAWSAPHQAFYPYDFDRREFYVGGRRVRMPGRPIRKDPRRH